MTFIKNNFSLPKINDIELLRYAGIKCKNAPQPNGLSELVQKAKASAEPLLTPALCYCEFPISVTESCVDFGFAAVASKQLCKNLEGCSSAVIFACTLGLSLDKEIAKRSLITPSLALMLDAVGSERIEAVCNCFEDELKSEKAVCGSSLRPRFSPGYGDLPLEFQKDIFRVLECQRHIGLFLGEGLLMTPSKSVTAIIGIRNNKE